MFTNATPGGGVAVRAAADRAEHTLLPRSSWTRAFLAGLALTACGESATQPQARGTLDLSVLAEAEVQILSGNDQEGVVGIALDDQLVVVVIDANGNPIFDVPVTWTFGSGRGSGRGNTSGGTIVTVTSDERGQVVVDWELGTRSGTQLAWAEIGTASTASTVTAEGAGPALAPKEGRGNQDRGKKVGFKTTGTPAEAAEILVSETSLTLEVGETVTLTAVVVDQYGNEIPDAVVEWTSSDPSIATVGAPVAAPTTSFVMLPSGATPPARAPTAPLVSDE